MAYWRENEFHDILSDDAYRSWLISRNDAPITYQPGGIRWKRSHVLLRRAARSIARFIAAVHIAIVAHKAHRAGGALARLNNHAQAGRRT